MDSNGNPTGEIGTDELLRHISYLSLPVYYSIKIKKMKFNVGLQTSISMVSSGEEKGQAPYNGTNVYFENSYKKLNIDSYDFGPKLGIVIDIWKGISGEINYYYGVNNILANNVNVSGWVWKVRQVMVGVKYTIYQKQRKC